MKPLRTLPAVILLLGTSFCLPLRADQTLPTKYEYDPQGNLTKVTDPRGMVTDHDYDSLHRLSKTELPIPLAGQSRPTIEYKYNGQGQLIEVDDPKDLDTKYTVNGFGETTKLLSSDTGTTDRTYDEAGNLKTSKDARNITTTYTYDSLNRPTIIQYGSTLTTTFTYDSGPNALGRRTRMQDNGVDTRWTYNTHGRLSGQQQTQGTFTHSVGYLYDAAGRLDKLTYPSGLQVTHTYDSAGRLHKLFVGGSKLLYQADAYQPFGGPTNITFGNGQVRLQEYDLDGRLKSYTRETDKNELTYDPSGRITKIKPNATQEHFFDYDDNDRLTGWAAPSTNQGYAYDLTGNRTQISIAGNTYAYSTPTDSHKLAGVSGPIQKNYSYDAAGNIKGDGAATYTYGDNGRLIRVTKGSVITNYTLNGLGQRVKKSRGSTTTYFVYDEGGQLLGEYNGSGTPIQEYVWVSGQPVAIMRGTTPTVYSVETDQLGAPRLVRGEGKNIRWRWEPDPFGTMPPEENPSGLGNFVLNLRFPGQYFDSESGLHYNYFRDYDPGTGRYVQSDPIGLWGGISTYGYVGGNPLSRIDPWGLCECKFDTKTYPNGTPDFNPWFWQTYTGTMECGYKCTDDQGGEFRISTTVTRRRGMFDDPNMIFVCPRVRVYYEGMPGPPWVRQAWTVESFDPLQSWNPDVVKQAKEKCPGCKK